MLAHWPEHPSVALVTTDGSCYPNAELERRGLLHRKGFPESYDRKALLRFVIDIKSGKDEVVAPTYSHLVYDVTPDEPVVVKRPDIVVVEGLNVLQPARARDDGRMGLAVSDFFDFSVYVDAATADIRRWYAERFLRLRETAFRDPASYFRRYADLTEDEASPRPAGSGTPSTGPNLAQNIAPTRGRANLVLQVGPVDVVPDPLRLGDGLVLGEGAVAGEVRRRVAERRLAQPQEPLDVPAPDVGGRGVDVHREVEVVADRQPGAAVLADPGRLRAR